MLIKNDKTSGSHVFIVLFGCGAVAPFSSNYLYVAHATWVYKKRSVSFVIHNLMLFIQNLQITGKNA